MILQDDIHKGSELFTAYLTNSKDEVDPFYTFGYIDDKIVGSQEIHYTPVDNTQGFWQISSLFTSVNGVPVRSTSGTAIIDTGTTLALIDDKTCRAVYAAIPGARQSKPVGVST